MDDPFVTCPSEPSLRGGGGNEMMYLNSHQAAMILPGTNCLNSNCVDSVESRNEMMFIPPIEQNVHYQGQGLSLSLGKEDHNIIPSFFQYHYSSNPSLSSDHMGTCVSSLGSNNQSVDCFSMASGFCGGNKTEDLGNPNGGFGYRFGNNVLNSKYLKAAQGLLDEVVNVRKALKHKLQGNIGSSDGLKGNDDGKANDPSSDPSETSANPPCEISLTERQNLQNKKTKLMSMLDQVRLLSLGLDLMHVF